MQAIRRAIVEQHELDPYAIVLIRQTSLPITSSGKVQRNLCREQYLADELKVVHSWTNPATNGRKPAAAGAAAWPCEAARRGRARCNAERRGAEPPRARRRGSVEVDRAAERIETWLLEWLVARLGLDAADVSRDRPFAEFGVDSLTAVELSQELEDEFKVPLPPIVAWNYPTPAALARYLAEQSLGAKPASETNGAAAPAAQVNGAANANGSVEAAAVDDRQLAELLSEIENLSDEEAAQMFGG